MGDVNNIGSLVGTPFTIKSVSVKRKSSCWTLPILLLLKDTVKRIILLENRKKNFVVVQITK